MESILPNGFAVLDNQGDVDNILATLTEALDYAVDYKFTTILMPNATTGSEHIYVSRGNQLGIEIYGTATQLDSLGG